MGALLLAGLGFAAGHIFLAGLLHVLFLYLHLHVILHHEVLFKYEYFVVAWVFGALDLFVVGRRVLVGLDDVGDVNVLDVLGSLGVFGGGLFLFGRTGHFLGFASREQFLPHALLAELLLE